MRPPFKIAFWSAGLLAFTLLTGCETSSPRVKSMAKKNEAVRLKPMVSVKDEKTHAAESVAFTTPAIIAAPDYEVTIYGAFGFVPDENGVGLISVDSGHRFVVLDMAVQNTSKNKVVDMGQILLSAQVTDEGGNVCPRSALAVAAFELEHPEASHKIEYQAMKGKIRPGKYYRTSAYGFEAPENTKNFIITLAEDGSSVTKSKVQVAGFSTD